MSLLILPNELLLCIAESLDCECDINALVQTNTRLYYSLNIFLYRFAVRRGNNSGLLWTAYHGSFPLVRMLLDMGVNPRTTRTTSTHMTALHFACTSGHQSIVEVLIQRGADVNARASTGITPLHEAVFAGFEDITRLRLEHRADLNGCTALHIACYFGFTSIVQLLLDTGISIEAIDRRHRTPLHYALQVDEDNFWNGNLRTVELLLQRKANIDAWGNGSRPRDLGRKHPNTAISILFSSGCNISFEQAIQKEQRFLRRKEEEDARERKRQEVVAKRAAKRMERLMREAGKIEKEKEQATERDGAQGELSVNLESLEKLYAIQRRWNEIKMEADEKHQQKEMEVKRDYLTKENICIVTTERQDAYRQAWSRIRAEAEDRNQQKSSPTTSKSLCFHPAAGWLKCKGRVLCDVCEVMCVKYSFQCGDCGIKVCPRCKTNRH